MPEPLEITDLQAFAKIVDTHSMSRAAAELKIPRATLGRRLARLEERLGARLLRRTTRSLQVTDAGSALYGHARIVLDAVASAEQSVRRADGAVRGDLRVSVPPLTTPSFLDMLGDFAKRYPEVRLHLHFGARHVDLRRDGYDVAIRGGTNFEPGLVARTLARTRVVAVASPAYLEAGGVPRSKADLRAHRCLMGFARGEVPQTQWPSGKGNVHVEGALFSNESAFLRDAALRGVGIALLPLTLVGQDLIEGRLVQVLPDQVGADAQFAAVYVEREFIAPQVRAFIDAAVAWAQAEPTLHQLVPCQEKVTRGKVPSASTAEKRRRRATMRR